MSSHLRPFYFNVVVWGEKYRDYFLNYCVASLLSPNNIPILENLDQCRFLIAAPKKDWEALQDEDMFLQLKQYIQPVFLEIPSKEADVPNCVHMGAGHKLATDMFFKDRAYGVLLTPDLLVSDGTFAHVQKMAKQGNKVVLIAAYRFNTNPLMQGLTSMGVVRKNHPLNITGRDLAKVGVKSLHPETMRYNWQTEYFAEFPIGCYWNISDDSILLHSFSWAPLLLDYSIIEDHDTSTMDQWTIDGDYVFKNFFQIIMNNYGTEKMAVITDSDDGMIVSWSTEEEYKITFERSRLKSLPIIGNWVKGGLLNNAFHSDVYDPLKRLLFFLPVYWHSQDIDSAWEKSETKAFKTFMDHIVIEPELYQSIISIRNQYGCSDEPEYTKYLKQVNQPTALKRQRTIGRFIKFKQKVIHWINQLIYICMNVPRITKGIIIPHIRLWYQRLFMSPLYYLYVNVPRITKGIIIPHIRLWYQRFLIYPIYRIKESIVKCLPEKDQERVNKYIRNTLALFNNKDRIDPQ